MLVHFYRENNSSNKYHSPRDGGSSPGRDRKVPKYTSQSISFICYCYYLNPFSSSGVSRMVASQVLSTQVSERNMGNSAALEQEPVMLEFTFDSVSEQTGNNDRF